MPRDELGHFVPGEGAEAPAPSTHRQQQRRSHHRSALAELTNKLKSQRKLAADQQAEINNLKSEIADLRQKFEDEIERKRRANDAKRKADWRANKKASHGLGVNNRSRQVQRNKPAMLKPNASSSKTQGL